MTSDADMIPLSDYWNPDAEKITCYGRDLTDYHYPMCFVVMTVKKWREIMSLDYIQPQDLSWANNYYIQETLKGREDAYSQDKVKRWVTDQNILTEKLNAYGKDRLTLIDRGMYSNGYPLGRVDRSAWHYNHQQFIDCHAPHDVLTNETSYNNLLELLSRTWPNEDFQWFKDYTTEFKKIVNG